MSECLQRWITGENKLKIYLATAVQKLKTQQHHVATLQTHLTARVERFLCPPRCGVKKEKKKKKKKRWRRCFVVILLTWAAHLPLSSAGARPAARLAYPGSFLVCASHLHTFLAGWRGLALIKASSHKFPPRILLVLRCHESVPVVAVAADDGTLLSKKKTTRRGVRRQRGGGWGREGGGGKTREKERRCKGRKGNSFCAAKTKEKAKEGKKKKSAVERERERERG